MKINFEHFDEYGTFILAPETDAEKKELKKIFDVGHPVAFGLNADDSLSIITQKSPTKFFVNRGVVNLRTSEKTGE